MSTQPQNRPLAMIAILLVLLLSALDQTIISTAMPTIIAQFNGLSRYSWVTTAYMLTSTVFVPVYGVLGDRYGRRAILAWGTTIFLAGSMLCGISGEFGAWPVVGDGMNQLILFRAVQGLGASGLATGAFGMIADLFTPSERGKYAGLFGGVFALASIVGPLIGGFFTDHGSMVVRGHDIAGWRWIFYVNIPLGLFALFILLTRLPKTRPIAHGRIDVLGGVLILVCFIPFLLALSWGGNNYPWLSVQVIGSVAVAAVAFGALLLVERGRPNAMLPIRLFRDRVIARSTLAMMTLNFGFMGIVLFLPLFLQIVIGTGATSSGVVLMPLMMGLIAGSIVGGRLASQLKRYKAVMIGGGLILVIGTLLLARIDIRTTTGELSALMVVVGFGLGPSQSLFTLAIQNAVPAEEIGAATSLAQFSRQIGATLGVAIFGTLLTHNLANALPRRLPEMAAMFKDGVKLDAIQGMALRSGVHGAQAAGAVAKHAAMGSRLAFADAIGGMLVVGAAISILGLFLTMAVPSRPLRD